MIGRKHLAQRLHMQIKSSLYGSRNNSGWGTWDGSSPHPPQLSFWLGIAKGSPVPCSLSGAQAPALL